MIKINNPKFFYQKLYILIKKIILFGTNKHKNKLSEPKNSTKTHVCEYCNKYSSTKSHLSIHLKKCKERKIVELNKQKDNEIQQIKEEIKQLKKKKNTRD